MDDNDNRTKPRCRWTSRIELFKDSNKISQQKACKAVSSIMSQNPEQKFTFNHQIPPPDLRMSPQKPKRKGEQNSPLVF